MKSTQVGSDIRLRARFEDDTGSNTQATNVWLRITDPEDNVLVTSGNPTYIGQGVFEYVYSVPLNGIDGKWTNEWYGDLPNQVVYASFDFYVTNSGNVSSITNQLFVNNLVEVTLGNTIKALDNSSFSEYTFTFLTETTPSYTNVRKVRLEYGGWLTDVLDLTLQLSILEASLEADEITFGRDLNSKVYQHARREWATCRTVANVMQNMASGMLKYKSLGDLSVSYDTQGLRDAMGKALDCMAKWEPQVISGGYALTQQNPQGVIKGELDPDRPHVGRLWSPMSGESTPAGNKKILPSGQRRYKTTFKKRYW